MAIDTFAVSPHDIAIDGLEVATACTVQAHSILVLEATGDLRTVQS